jgi:hypothetical protein
MPCFVEINFIDGKAFKSAGSGKTLTPKTLKRLKLVKQLPNDSAATDALKGAATVISGLTVGLALATPLLSAGLGKLQHMINGLQVVLYFPLMNVFAPSNLGVL